MTRRGRQRFAPTAGEPTDRLIEPRALLTANDGGTWTLDLAAVLHGTGSDAIKESIIRAAIQDAGRRRKGDRRSLRTTCHGVENAAVLILRACVVEGVLHPSAIRPTLMDLIQRSLQNSGYTFSTMQHTLGYVSAIVRRMEGATDPELATRLRSAVRKELLPPSTKAVHVRVPSEPFSRTETARFISFCRRAIDESYHRLCVEARQLLEGAQDPRLDPSSMENGWPSTRGIAWEFANSGPTSQKPLTRRLRVPHIWLRDEHRELPIIQIRHTLFPGQQDLVPAYWLFCLLTGIEPQSAQSLRLANLEGGIAVYLKPRGGKETEVRDLGPSARRLIQKVVEMTANARRFAKEEDRDAIWLFLCPSGPNRNTIQRCPFSGDGFKAMKLGHGVEADSGELLKVNGRRLRATNVKGRKPSDPLPDQSHSAKVDLVNYTLNKANEEHLQGTVEKGLEAAGREALVIPMFDVDADEAAELPPVNQDSFVGGCVNPEDSPFTTKGTACSADPWMCFRCGNCRIGPRHLPNLLAWRSWIESQHDLMPDTGWNRQWGEIYFLLTHEILPRFRPDQITAAEPLSNEIDPSLWMPMRAVVDLIVVEAR